MAKKAPDPEKIRRKAMWSIRLSVLLMIACAMVFLAASMVFLVCMLPTLVAALIDKHQQKTLWMTIGAVNLAGTVPAWFRLWDQGRSISAALDIMTDPAALLVAYGASALGWVIHMNVTPMVASLIVRRNESRLKDIEKRQRELVRKWGDEVAKSIN